ncbi:MAG TPA: alpha/beta fold hydrolase [Vicinamibacterales bacterium]|nr:alpha/beta fold hydrolase [Vicinamibacterales bacterium]
MTDYAPTRSAPCALLILAHGAGAGQHSPFMKRVARDIADRGVAVTTFDFPYMAARRKLPDKAPVLEQAWRDTIDAVRSRAELRDLPLFIGGKSMGGRIASQVASSGATGVAGLVFLGYPLHPPGKPEQRRDAHLGAIGEPMLFVQGERDAFGTAAEIHELLTRFAGRATLHVVAGGDHSFNVPASARRTRDDVHREVAAAVAVWIRRAVE